MMRLKLPARSRPNRRPRTDAMLHSRRGERIDAEGLAMHQPNRRLRSGWPLAAAVSACLALAACGGGSGDATKLLRQTFGGSHTVKSGNLNLSLTINPSGSRTLRAPIFL